ncbi:MAG: hypothetical protein ACRC41_14185, partial [Sarcina sp.]
MITYYQFTNLKDSTPKLTTVNSIEEKTISKPIADKIILEESLKKISSNVRNFGSDGSIQTSEYLKEKLLEYDYDVTFQNFEIYKQDSNSTVYTKTNLEYLDLNPYNSKKLGTGRNVIALP